MAQIDLQALRKMFGAVVAVDRVDLTIADGTFTVLLGPSGCGKTTTLNMIAGLEEVTDGSILFDGDEVQDLPPHKRDIAMVFQSYALYPNRTVRENMAFPLRMRHVNSREIETRVASVASKLGASLNTRWITLSALVPSSDTAPAGSSSIAFRSTGVLLIERWRKFGRCGTSSRTPAPLTFVSSRLRTTNSRRPFNRVRPRSVIEHR